MVWGHPLIVDAGWVRCWEGLKECFRLRLGVSIQCEDKSYDILEMPVELFICLVPGLNEERFWKIDSLFQDFWPEDTERRRHILHFATEHCGVALDELFVYRTQISFDDEDLLFYIEQHLKQGNRPS